MCWMANCMKAVMDIAKSKEAHGRYFNLMRTTGKSGTLQKKKKNPPFWQRTKHPEILLVTTQEGKFLLGAKDLKQNSTLDPTGNTKSNSG